MGAYFPGWLLASMMGIILSACSKIVLSKAGLHRELVWPVLFYVCLTFLWSGMLWILLFD